MGDSESLAGRVLMVGLPGTTLDGATAERVRALAPGGVILFRRNLESPEQTATLLQEVRRLLSDQPGIMPLALCVFGPAPMVDQQGIVGAEVVSVNSLLPTSHRTV